MASKINIPAIVRKAGSNKLKLAKLVANTSKNFFQDSFRNQGFTDHGLVKWKKLSDKTLKYKKKNKNLILVEHGKLQKSVRVIQLNSNKVVVGTNSTFYASYHNRGWRVPKRQFIGQSHVLDQKLRRLTKEYIRTIWQ